MANVYAQFVKQQAPINQGGQQVPTQSGGANVYEQFVKPQQQTPPTMEQQLKEAGGGRSAVSDLTQGAIGAGETGLQMLTGTGAAAYGGMKSMYDLATGDSLEDAAKDIQQAEQDYTYQPRTEAGQAISKGIGKAVSTVMDPVQHVADNAANHIYRETGSEMLAGIVRSIPNAALIIAPEVPKVFRGAKGVVRRARGLEEAEPRTTPEVETPTETPDLQTQLESTAGEEPRDMEPLSTPEDVPKQIMEAAKASEKEQAKKADVVASQFDPDIKRVEAAKRLGIEHALLPSSTARNQQAIEIERGLASKRGSKLSVAAQEETKAIAQKADDLITDFGGSTDKAALSDKLKASIDTSIKNLDDKSEELYEKIDESIPRTARVNTSGIKTKLKQEANDMGGARNLEPIEKKVLKMANTEGGPTYALIEKERKKVGDALRKSQGPYKDANSGTLKKLYGMITEAQEGTASEHGMADTWNAAKNLVVKRKQLEDNSVKLLGKNLTGAIMPKVGASMKKLSSGDYKNFDEVMGALPESERGEVVMSALNDVFTGGSRKEKQLSIPAFDDWMNGLSKNKAAKARVYKYMPKGAPERLEDMHTIAKGIREAQSKEISTGLLDTLVKEFDSQDGIMSRLYGLGKKGLFVAGASHFGPLVASMAAAGSVASEILSRSPKVPLTKAADEMLANPMFRKAVIEYASATSEAKRASIERTMARRPVVRKWLKSVGEASVKVGKSDESKRIAKLGVMNYLTQPGKDES